MMDDGDESLAKPLWVYYLIAFGITPNACHLFSSSFSCIVIFSDTSTIYNIMSLS